MGNSVISLGLGLGGGKAATISGLMLSSGAFKVEIFDTESNILARTGDPVGTIAFGTDTNDYYISDGNNNWSITLNVNF
jgi:hypothetical protein